MKLIGLSRTIALTMAAMAFGITLLVVVTSYVFYFITFHFWQGSISEPNMFPSGLEWAWLGSTTLAGVRRDSGHALGTSHSGTAKLRHRKHASRRARRPGGTRHDG